MNSNQVRFSEHEFPFRNRKMVDQFLSDNSIDILYQHASDVKWIPYNKLHVVYYEKVHYDTKSDVVVLSLSQGKKSGEHMHPCNPRQVVQRPIDAE